ncbi:MAG: rRNA (uracil1498-N3)-methyltransferase [Micromonosporaceae bacterium]
MSLGLFLVDELPSGDGMVLDGPEGHHAADVARLRVGERLLLGDGRGGTACAVVTAAGRGRLGLSIVERRYADRPRPRLVVAQGLAKGERAELAVQMMTEAGVDEIVPWNAARSVVRWSAERADRALDRWVATAREAAKQARRGWLPDVSPPVPTAALVPRATFVLHEDATVPLSTVELPAREELVLVVGPEGGIAPEELDQFVRAGAVPVRLGGTVLRTSTAGVAALAVLSARLGRW